jgi:hypothetical protein
MGVEPKNLPKTASLSSSPVNFVPNRPRSAKRQRTEIKRRRIGYKQIGRHRDVLVFVFPGIGAIDVRYGCRWNTFGSGASNMTTAIPIAPPTIVSQPRAVSVATVYSPLAAMVTISANA